MVDVAKYVLMLAAEDRKNLTHKQLQKILYYIQGYSLGRKDTRLFREQIRAWREGPVVKEVWDLLKEDDGWASLAFRDGDDEVIHPLSRAFIASIWEDLKGHRATKLWMPSAAACGWLRVLDAYDIDEIVGFVPESYMELIVREVRRLNPNTLGNKQSVRPGAITPKNQTQNG